MTQRTLRSCPGVWPALALLGLLLALPAAATADDVLDEVRAAYDAGRGLLAKGDRGSLERAFVLLDVRKDEALGSVDYWEVYARVWTGLDKGADALEQALAERQARDESSPVFDLVRARLAKDAAARRKLLETAAKRNAQDLRAKVALANLLLDGEQEDDADELLDEILKADATCEGALLGKARLALSDGLPREAIQFLDRGIQKAPSAELYYSKALCLQRLAQDESAVMEQALDAAARALGMEPNEAHIKLYDELLKESGDAATAAKALKEHFARTKHPLLAAMLAESAFKAGDYEGAVMGLNAGDGSDLASVKGLAVAHARLGNKADAQRHARKVVDMDSKGRLFAARIDLLLGDTEGVKARLGALADDDAKRLRAQAHAWAGEAEAVKALVAAQARDGSRDGEELLVAWFQARLFEKLGAAKADSLRKSMLAARVAAMAKPLPQGSHWGTELGQAKTEGWPARAVTWFRAPCGVFFRAGGSGSSSSINMGDSKEFTVSRSITAEARCGSEDQNGNFNYNSKTIKSSDGRPPWVELFGNPDEQLADFKPAEKAFAEACAAWLGGNDEAAETACAQALKIEPGWSRIKVLRALGRALGSGADRRADAKEAKEAVAMWTDDFELRRSVILLRAWAGDAELPQEIEALAKREAEFNVRSIDAL